LAKYDFGRSPRIDSKIPNHLLPTPLQKKTESKLSPDDISKKYRFDGGPADISFNFGNKTHPTTTGNGSGFIDDEDDDFGRNENRSNGNNAISSPSGIKFSFGDDNQSKRDVMSPIPFARTIGKTDSGSSATDAFSRFIPTPLQNSRHKKKSHRP